MCFYVMICHISLCNIDVKSDMEAAFTSVQDVHEQFLTAEIKKEIHLDENRMFLNVQQRERTFCTNSI